MFDQACADALSTPGGDGRNDDAMREEANRRAYRMTDRLAAAQEAVGSRIRALYAD